MTLIFRQFSATGRVFRGPRAPCLPRERCARLGKKVGTVGEEEEKIGSVLFSCIACFAVAAWHELSCALFAEAAPESRYHMLSRQSLSNGIAILFSERGYLG